MYNKSEYIQAPDTVRSTGFWYCTCTTGTYRLETTSTLETVHQVVAGTGTLVSTVPGTGTGTVPVGILLLGTMHQIQDVDQIVGLHQESISRKLGSCL